MTKTFDAPMVRADAMRPCDACGGTGWSKPCGCNSDGRGEGMARAHYHLCRVCGGTNRFPVRMPAADAMADAETLRRFCDEHIYSAEFPMLSSYPLIAIWKCGNSGWTVRSINRGKEFDAWSRAEGQAHAAFRAVPGLRG